MDITVIIKAIIMGIVEGLTEFLPISSTGHLILTGSLIDFTGENIKVFSIAIQSGAMLSVVWVYREKIIRILLGLFKGQAETKLAVNVIVAFLPAAVIGVLFAKKISDFLFHPLPVAAAFIIGGFIILLAERRHERQGGTGIASMDDMSWKDALKVGIAQVFALIPGTSRSGATIIGGLLFGLSRKTATEFSFFLAMPTLFGAGVYSVWRERALLNSSDIPLFTIGSVAAFVAAFICVRWLLRFISNNNFTVFAWYRIAFGILILVTNYFGWVQWVD